MNELGKLTPALAITEQPVPTLDEQVAILRHGRLSLATTQLQAMELEDLNLAAAIINAIRQAPRLPPMPPKPVVPRRPATTRKKRGGR